MNNNKNKVAKKGFAFKVKSSTANDAVDIVPKKTTTIAPEHLIHESSGVTTKAAVPIAETPIIKSNKKLRDTLGGRRRSSIGLRGKRLSAMMNSGQIGSPHPSIPPSSYYKLIDAGLPDAARMRQLLTWCAQHTAARYPGPSASSTNPADVLLQKVQRDMIAGLSNKAINTSWYEFQDTQVSTTSRKPHPLNLEHAQKRQEFQAQLEKCQKEEEQWMAIQSQIKMMQHQESQATAASPAELNGLLPESYKRVLNQAETTSHELNEFLSSLSEQENMETLKLKHELLRASAMTNLLGSKCEGMYTNLLETFEQVDDKDLDAIDVLRLFSKTSTPAAQM